MCCVHSSRLKIFRYKTIDIPRNQPIPASKPVACTAQNGHNTFRISPIETGRIQYPGSYTLFFFGKEITKVMWYFSSVNIPYCLQCTESQVILISSTVTPG